MIGKRIKTVIISVVAGVTSVTGLSVSSEAEGSHTDMRNITTMELVRDMGIGINLGNTMESCGDWIAQWGDGSVKSYETAWGSPVITKAMIDGYSDEGFGVLRIPVAWSNLMGDNYTISSDYMQRVKEIVDWTIDADMYAIINIHYDNGWVNNFPENKDESMRRYVRMWEQICEGFKDYGDYLMFESQNEELGWNSLWNQWGGTDEGKAESYSLVNEINQKFVDVVRNSGGNNGKRHLLISGYGTSIDLTCDPLFKMPNDPENRCAVSVHYYTPSTFAILEEDADWGKMRSTWGTDADFAELNQQMDLMKTTYIDKGVPVIIGEYGCPTKNKEVDSVRRFLSSVCKAAYDRHMCPVLWSTPGEHYDRDTCKIIDPQVKELLMSIPEKKQPVTTEPTTTTTTTTTITTTTTEITTSTTEDPVQLKYDINADGTFSLADIVCLQKWLVNADTISNKAAADLDGNGRINVFDLALLKNIYFNIRS
ncbi:MAG: cellulase family glycosylhydrolase [Oscillospiraceae bacterium]|nr:cellulase family glycosylhydrolase [Oscillospiraceae bacterium]